MKLTIEIDCDSSDIQENPEGLGDILRKLAEKLDNYETNVAVSGRMLDANGNTVGFYKRM